MDEATLKATLLEIFAALGLTHAGREGDSWRWSASDLATDLAPRLVAALRAAETEGDA